MYIIAGLGNPTKEYENTRHNVGFMCIDTLAERYDIKINEHKHKALIGKGYIEGQKVILVKPLTYMNNSGESIREILDFYKLDAEEDLLIIYDDIDLDVGKLRIRAKGSAGGHNGIKSIIQHTGTAGFNRIRVGVGAKPEGGDLVNHVLGHFKGEDLEGINAARKKVTDATTVIITDGIDKAMNLYN